MVLTGRHVPPGIVLVVIVLVSIGLMMLDHARSTLSPVRSTLAIAMQPVMFLAELPSDITEYLGRYYDREALVSDNQQLNHKVLLLQARLQRMAALRSENERIRALLASASAIDQNVLIAQILSVTPDPYRHAIKLDKGARDGVFAGQALIDANGIMGQVTDVTAITSQAALITDANHGIPVEINRTGLRTIAQGTGKTDELRLPFLANNADIQRGDLLVTSGLGGRYPTGYPVAEVTRVTHTPGDEFLDIAARPTAHLNRGREVLLVWTHNDAQPPETPAAGDDDSGAGPSQNAPDADDTADAS